MEPKQRLEELDKILDEYVQSKGLGGQIPNKDDASQYLHMSMIELRKLNAEECGEIAFLLSQFSLFLQKEYNVENSRLNWAGEQINKIIASTTLQQGSKYSPYEERRNLAIRDDAAAYKLNDIKIYAQARIDRLHFLAQHVQQLSKTLIELQQTKRRQ